MISALAARSVEDLNLETIFRMRESWWRYHLTRWAESDDSILRDLSQRILNRRLLKTIRMHGVEQLEDAKKRASKVLTEIGLDPRYYLHEISTADVHAGDFRQSMLVRMDDGRVITLAEADPLFNAMAVESRGARRSWLALPSEAKIVLGRER